MTNDERNLTQDNEDMPESSLPDDDARFAPPLESQAESSSADEEDSFAERTADEPLSDIDIPVTNGMDIEAALAAVSTLSDMLAEQEAAEQARIAQAEAEAQAAAERQARLEHPERFFPVPPMSTLHRGQMASVVPALLLIALGAGLTFILTTTKSLPDPGLTIAVTLGSLGLILLVRWLTSGRWSRGALFGGLSLLLSAALLIFLLQPASPGLVGGWPLLLLAPGIAAVAAGFFAIPRDTRLLLPGIALIVAGIAGFIVSTGLLGSEFVNIAATLWPVPLVIIAIVWALPLLFRQRS